MVNLNITHRGKEYSESYNSSSVIERLVFMIFYYRFLIINTHNTIQITDQDERLRKDLNFFLSIILIYHQRIIR